MVVPSPHGAQIVQACGQIVVAARRNGEKVFWAAAKMRRFPDDRPVLTLYTLGMRREWDRHA
jgi:hypothetical protein